MQIAILITTCVLIIDFHIGIGLRGGQADEAAWPRRLGFCAGSTMQHGSVHRPHACAEAVSLALLLRDVVKNVHINRQSDAVCFTLHVGASGFCADIGLLCNILLQSTAAAAAAADASGRRTSERSHDYDAAAAMLRRRTSQKGSNNEPSVQAMRARASEMFRQLGH